MNHRDANPPRHLQDGASRPSSQSPREERTSAESTHNLHTRQPFERPSQSAMRLIEHDPGHSASAQGFARQQLSNVVEDPRYIPYPHISTQNLASAPSMENYSASLHQYSMQGSSTAHQFHPPISTGGSNWQFSNSIADMRRDTITQASHDALSGTTQRYSSSMGHGSQRHGNLYPSYPRPHRHSQGHSIWSDPPESSYASPSYSPVSERRDTIRPYNHPLQDVRRGIPSTSGLVNEPSPLPYSGGHLAGSIAIPQLASTEQQLYYDKNMSHPSQKAEFAAYQSPEATVDQAGTPAPTEGSADPEQSDQDESEWPTSTVASATSPTGPVPNGPRFDDQYLPSGSTRWARFQVPTDVFLNPHDPARYHLLYTIRRETWFLRQTNERPLSADEAAQIPNAIPGESVLLGFFDRFTERDSGRVTFICTICQRSSPNPKPYNRPDRAKVHMRHHLEQRPIPCTGQCRKLGCAQRFFTQSDLSAHIAGKTESLVNCEWCNKPLRQKNMKRHQKLYCPKAPGPSQQ